MIMLIPSAYEWFEEWQAELKGKRGSDYETFKNSFVEASMSVVMKLFPQLEGKVGGKIFGVVTDLMVPFLPFPCKDRGIGPHDMSPREGQGTHTHSQQMGDSGRGRGARISRARPTLCALRWRV